MPSLRPVSPADSQTTIIPSSVEAVRPTRRQQQYWVDGRLAVISSRRSERGQHGDAPQHEDGDAIAARGSRQLRARRHDCGSVQDYSHIRSRHPAERDSDRAPDEGGNLVTVTGPRRQRHACIHPTAPRDSGHFKLSRANSATGSTLRSPGRPCSPSSRVLPRTAPCGCRRTHPAQLGGRFVWYFHDINRTILAGVARGGRRRCAELIGDANLWAT